MSNNKLDRIHGPDVLRGFAACGVVFFHVLYLSGIEISRIVHVLVGRFDFFVLLFFAISAFSMAYAYKAKLNSQDQLRIFYIRRFFRIAPLFYFIVIFSVGYQYFYSRQLPETYDLSLNLLFVFPFTPGKQGSLAGGGWSIGVEWIFYLAFPLILSFVRSLRASFIIWAIFCFIAIIGHNHFTNYLGGALREYGLLFFLSHIHYFMVGFIIYLIFEIKNNWLFMNKNLNGYFLILFLSMIITYFRYQYFAPEELALSFLIFILLFLSVSGLPAWLDNRFSRYLGLISYSVYLVQFPVIQILNDSGFYRLVISSYRNTEIAYLIVSSTTLITVLIVSSLTYRIIELPGQSFGRVISK